MPLVGQAGSPRAREGKGEGGKHSSVVSIEQQRTLAEEGNGKRIRNCICLNLRQFKQTQSQALVLLTFRSDFSENLGSAV